MQAIKCSTHAHENCNLYCKDCETHQLACIQCIITTGKHHGHKVDSLQAGVIQLTEKAESYVTCTEQARLQAIKRFKVLADFDTHVKQTVLEPLRELDNTIDELVNDLRQVQVDVHTAMLQAAQTARQQSRREIKNDYAKLILAVRSAKRWARQVRSSLKDASLSNLSELVDITHLARQESAKLQKAMQAANVDCNKVEINTMICTRVSSQLGQLKEQACLLQRCVRTNVSIYFAITFNILLINPYSKRMLYSNQ